MQIALHNQIILRLMRQGIDLREKCQILSYNDDNAAGFEIEDDLEIYWDEEDVLFEDLSLMKRPDKSFKGGEFVLCETYHPQFGYKESYARREALSALGACNITHAKGIITSLSSGFNYTILEEYLNEIITYWGYEFHPCEAKQPAILGGWISYKSKGVSFDLTKIKDTPYNAKLYAASKLHTLWFRRRKLKDNIRFIPPLLKLRNLDMFDDPYGKYFSFCTLDELQRMYLRSSFNPKDTFMAWQKLLKHRRYAFGETKNETSRALLEETIIRENYTIDYIPELSASWKKHSFERTNALFENSQVFLRSTNPRCAYLKHYWPEKFSDLDVSPNPLPFLIMGSGPYNYPRSTEVRRIENSMIGARSPEDYLLLDKFLSEPENLDYLRSYINPFLVIQMCKSKGYYNIPFPTIIPQEKEVLIKIRESEEFTLEHLKLIGDRKVDNFDNLVRQLKGDPVENGELLQELSMKEEFIEQFFPHLIPPPPDPDYDSEEEIAKIAESELLTWVIVDEDPSEYWQWKSHASRFKKLD
jgi:hypothetical protein